ncbi:MAG: hypothetical protein AAGJ35_02775, partial [Myxococcota bacterium]
MWTSNLRLLRIALLLCLGLLMACDGNGPITENVNTNGDGGVPEAVASESTETKEQEDNCKPGTAACRCDGERCDKGLRCESALCVACTLGSPGCGCLEDGSCDFGNQCEQNVCKGCVGKEKCPCYGNGNCDPGFLCKQTSSYLRSCQKCDGNDKAGCNCKDDTECGSGLECINQRCQKVEASLQPPKNPKCYTPCVDDLRIEGRLYNCHPKFKLREGCLQGQSCQQGSCVQDSLEDKLPGSKYPFCQSSADCPGWQTCIQGRCYSTCTADSECSAGRKCFRYVCRKSCGSAGTCYRDEQCDLQSETAGHCIPRSNIQLSANPSTKTPGTFEIPFQNLQFSNFQTSQDLIINNQASQPTTFTLKPIFHTLAQGKPLFWLKFALCTTYDDQARNNCTGFETAQNLKEGAYVLPSVPAKTKVIVRISNAAGRPSGINFYTGQIQVTGSQLGSQQISVDFRQSVAGQWQGQMVFFGSFEDSNIERFPSSRPLSLNQINNALMRRW